MRSKPFKWQYQLDFCVHKTLQKKSGKQSHPRHTHLGITTMTERNTFTLKTEEIAEGISR